MAHREECLGVDKFPANGRSLGRCWDVICPIGCNVYRTESEVSWLSQTKVLMGCCKIKYVCGTVRGIMQTR